MIGIIRVLLLLMIPIHCTAQTPVIKRLDSLFYILSTNKQAMGSIAISKNGKMIYTRAIGYIDSDKTLANTTTKYRIASITKMMTATIILQLVEEGKLTLDTKLSTFYPIMPNAQNITIKNLLSHRSGWHNFTDNPNFGSIKSVPHSKDDMLRLCQSQPTDSRADSAFAYSNTNYIILGFIIEAITGMPYGEALKQRIVAPLGLKNTYLAGRVNPSNNECLPYVMTTDWIRQTNTDSMMLGAAGGIVSTPAELTTFIEALFSLRLISAKSLKLMTNTIEGYGLGMMQFPFYERQTLGHTGGIDGYESILSYFPKDNIAIAYCSNGVVYPKNDLMIGVLSILFQKPYTLPSFTSQANINMDLTSYIGYYTSEQIPLEITITIKNGLLMAQATGQQAFTLSYEGNNIFRFAPADVMIAFNLEARQFTMIQRGAAFLYKKK